MPLNTVNVSCTSGEVFATSIRNKVYVQVVNGADAVEIEMTASQAKELANALLEVGGWDALDG